MSNREDKIQKLLRHAFGCVHNNTATCSCAKNIREFLLTDKTSLAWAKNTKNASSKPKIIITSTTSENNPFCEHKYLNADYCDDCMAFVPHLKEASEKIAHLQKLCEEQRDTLDSIKEAIGGASSHPETGVSIVDDVRDLKSQLATQMKLAAAWKKKYKEYSTYAIALADCEKEKAAQTERVQTLEKELEVLRGK